MDNVKKNNINGILFPEKKIPIKLVKKTMK